jgi:anti-sigma factor RsiW
MDIEALVDNELDLQTAARVRAAVQHDPQMHRAYNKLVAQKKLLNMWWHNQQHH